MADTGIIRCPVCMSSQSFSTNTPTSSIIHCGNCKKDFRYGNALPLSGVVNEPLESQTATVTNSVIRDRESSTSIMMQFMLGLVGIILFFALVYPIRNYVQPLRGPSFLIFFVVFFLVIWMAVLVLRNIIGEHLLVTLSGLAIFEAVGIYRYIDGAAVGMHNFGGLFFAMMVGGVILFTRTSNFSEYFDNNNCSSSCSSCNSGCGGGGGCGGCGD